MLLSDAFELYVAQLIEAQWTDAHIRTERDRMSRFVFGHRNSKNAVFQSRAERDIETITRTELAKYFIALRDGRADGTMAGYTTTHKNFWGFCQRQKWVPENLATGLRKYSADPQVRQPAPEEDIQKVIDCLDAFIQRRNQHPADVRDALLVSLSIDCGKRLGAMCDLLRADVEEALQYPRRARNGRSSYWVIVNRGKTGAVNIEFFDETAELFRLWFRLMPKSERVFVSTKTGEPLIRNSAARAFVGICRFAGVRPFRSHAVRKRNVNEIIENTDPEVGQRYAGHKSLETTLRHYKDKKPVAVMNAAADLASSRRGETADEYEEMAKLFGVHRGRA